MLSEGPENAVTIKLIRNMLVIEILACLSSSPVAAAGLMTDNIVRELLSVGMTGFQNSTRQGQY